jgi:hypothetical protein
MRISIAATFANTQVRQIAAPLVSILAAMNHIGRGLENHAEVLPLRCEKRGRPATICLKTCGKK